MRDRILTSIASYVVNKPWWTLLWIMIVTIVCAGMMGQLSISTEFQDMMPQDDPSIIEFNTISEEYNATSTLYIVAEGDGQALRAFADEAIVIFHDVVDIMGVAVGGPHEAHKGLIEAEPFADHVHVDIAEGLIHEVLVFLDPGSGAGEFGTPEETDGAFGSGQSSLFDEGVQDAGDFEDAGAAGFVVAGALFGDAFKEMGR